MPSGPFRPPVKITVKSSKGKGRGVFATARIRAGEVIETAPVLLVPKDQADVLAATFLGHYMFQTDNGRHYVIGLGLTSMVNHDDQPNAEFFATIDHVVVKATRAIAVGAEITIDYGWGQAEWASVGIAYEPPSGRSPD
jgi:SET domain-containing protein